MLAAAAIWARLEAARHPGVRRIGCFGSYATGRAGPGSDLDLVVVVDATSLPFERRGADWDTTSLPVPVDLLIYTVAEWAMLTADVSGFGKTLGRETRWLVEVG